MSTKYLFWWGVVILLTGFFVGGREPITHAEVLGLVGALILIISRAMEKGGAK